MKLKCFIASAFDKKDVDTIYTRVIVPVLKKYSIIPLRVDKIEHNEDIDDKIFSLLNVADFCIADITYARPSVYYEAGYAFGKGKQVIYTVRNDHFKPRITDPEGILKVHFDLQMKNIIPWINANNSFKQKLNRRIKKIIRPLLLENKKQQKREEEYNAFKVLSISRKQYLLTQAAIKFFILHNYLFPDNTNFETKKRSFACTKLLYNRNVDLRFYCDNTITKKMLQDFQSSLYLIPNRFKNSKDVIIHSIFVSLNSFTLTRAQDALHDYQLLQNKSFCNSIENHGDKKKITSYIHIMDSIKSGNDFKIKFQNLLNDNKLIK